MSVLLLFAVAFLACAVEMVEALTIVLGVGVVRGWRSPLVGVAVATLVLAADRPIERFVGGQYDRACLRSLGLL